MSNPRSSRDRYKGFVQSYQLGKLDAEAEQAAADKPAGMSKDGPESSSKEACSRAGAASISASTSAGSSRTAPASP